MHTIQFLRPKTTDAAEICQVQVVTCGVASPNRGQFEFLSYDPGDYDLTEAEERTITREIRRAFPDDFVVSALTWESLQNDSNDQREDKRARASE